MDSQLVSDLDAITRNLIALDQAHLILEDSIAYERELVLSPLSMDGYVSQILSTILSSRPLEPGLLAVAKFLQPFPGLQTV